MTRFHIAKFNKYADKYLKTSTKPDDPCILLYTCLHLFTHVLPYLRHNSAGFRSLEERSWNTKEPSLDPHKTISSKPNERKNLGGTPLMAKIRLTKKKIGS